MERESVASIRYTEQLAALTGFITPACAFTGHRPRKFPWRGEGTAPECAALKKTLAEQIAALVGAGYTDFLSGMAEGTDTWAVQIVLALREKNPALRLHCILPSFDQSAKWVDSSWERYRSILE